MAGRSGPTFQKRQKEKARQERQREKFEQRSARKQAREAGVPSGNNEIDYSYSPFADMEPLPSNENQ